LISSRPACFHSSEQQLEHSVGVIRGLDGTWCVVCQGLHVLYVRGICGLHGGWDL
jgi:hypothetical protein